MIVDTTKESVCINQIVGQKNENRIIEGDMIVPDIKPDILNTITTSSNVCIYKKEVLDGKVKIEGALQVHIMYLADNEEGSVRGINTSLDFTQIIPIDSCKEGMNINVKIDINSIDTKVLNGRKLSVKASLGFSIKLYSNENINVIKEINGNENIQKLNRDVEIHSLIGEGIAKAYAKETLAIDPADNLAEVLKVDFKIQNKDTKVSYNKVLAKADAVIRILYLTEDNRINTVESIIPVMGFVDIQNVSEEHLCDTNYELKNFVIKPNGEDEHSIYVEAELEISCYSFEKRNMTLTEDLYSPTETLNFTKKEINTMNNKIASMEMYSLKERISVPEIMGNKINDISVKIILNTQNLSNGKVSYDGDINLKVLYSKENSIDVKQITLPFQFSIENPNIFNTSNIGTDVEIVKQDFVLQPDGSLEARVDIAFLLKIENYRNISVIDEIMLEKNEREDNYSMIIYFVKQGDTLWNIAKRFGSTVEDIERVNGIENADVLQVGKQLFIPRYNARRSA